MIKVEHQNKVAIIRLYRPPANAIDIDFCSALETAIKSEIDSGTIAIVLTGQGTIFSAGVDLPKLVNGGADYVSRFLDKLEKLIETLFFCPKPLVCAINGHAIAGGCVIACCADRRLMAYGSGRIGVPELRVGVPFPVIIMELMRNRVGTASFEEIIMGGDTYSADTALKKGLIDEIVRAEALLENAIDCACALAEIRPEIFSFTKRQVRQPVRDAMHAQDRFNRGQIHTIWQSEPTREAIREYMEKTFKNKKS